MALDDIVYWLRESIGVARAERRRIARDDPWRRLDFEPPLWTYGPGATVDFESYLQRASRVDVRTPSQIGRWLLGCRYADDPSLLGEHDQWQHPSTFELVRSGDCEDFALWAWRKLVEAEYEAEFVVGVRRRADGASGRHAWVMFREGGTDFLFDGVERSIDRMIVDLAAVKQAYEPQVGAAPNGSRFVFAGLYRSDWGSRLVLPRRRR